MEKKGKVLVTGASSGIGKVTAELLALSGWTVYALSRRQEEIAVSKGNGSITGLKGDVTDLASLKTVLSQIEDLDAVVHCAGFGISGSAECTPMEAARKQMETNYFGVLNVNGLVLPLMRRHQRSHVVIVSSFAGIVPIPFQSHYSSSKYALEAYGEALSMEAKEFGVSVTLVEPGDTCTGFTTARTHNEPDSSPYFEKCGRAVGRMEKDERNGKSPESVARVISKVLCQKRPPLRVVVGLDYKLLSFLVKILPSSFRDFILSRMYQ